MINKFHPHYIDCFLRLLLRPYWFFINTLKAKWWHVKVGKGAVYSGISSFRLVPKSSIIFGNNCIFLSSSTSNRIGIYCPCMFTTLYGGAKIQIGDNCGFSGTVIGCAVSIKLGNNVRCGANTLITDTDWHNDDSRTGKNAPVVIDDNVWLGYGVKILKGVHIGKNSLIGAGSIVTKDIPANVIAAGNPCKIIRYI